MELQTILLFALSGSPGLATENDSSVGYTEYKEAIDAVTIEYGDKDFSD